MYTLQAFETVLNKDSRAARHLSLYLDVIFRKASRGVTDIETEQKLDEVLVLFRYLRDKDIFEAVYKQVSSLSSPLFPLLPLLLFVLAYLSLDRSILKKIDFFLAELIHDVRAEEALCKQIDRIEADAFAIDSLKIK